MLAGYDEDVFANLVTECSRTAAYRIEGNDGFDGVTVAAPGSGTRPKRLLARFWGGRMTEKSSEPARRPENSLRLEVDRLQHGADASVVGAQ